ncbi:MAG: hypothetical protein ACOY41_12930 [Pseudomonadota bacterium]
MVYFIALFDMFLLGYYNYYVFYSNQTNHTSINPYALYVFLIPILIFSFQKLRMDRRWIIPFVVSAAGILNILVFDVLDVMSGYGMWISKGMPPRPEWSCIQECVND